MALTTITDTVYTGDGSLFTGRLLIKAQGFKTAGSVTVGPTYKNVTVTNGAVSIQLHSLTGATPSGLSYRVEYYVSGAALPIRVEYWVPTDTTPVTIPDIVTFVQPTPVYTISLGNLAQGSATGTNLWDIRWSGSTWAAKALFDSTVGSNHGTAAAGTAVEASRDDHVHPVTPAAAAGFDWGSATLPWKELYLAGTSGTPGTNNFKITGASTSGTRVVTLADGASVTVVADAGASNNFLTGITTAGAITKAQPAFTNISGIATPAQLSHTVRDQTTTSDTMLDSDRGKLVTHSNAGAIAVTLPQAGGGGSFISGWFVFVNNRGAGTVTITPTTSTIDGAATLVLTTNQGAIIFSDGTNYFTMR